MFDELFCEQTSNDIFIFDFIIFLLFRNAYTFEWFNYISRTIWSVRSGKRIADERNFLNEIVMAGSRGAS